MSHLRPQDVAVTGDHRICTQIVDLSTMELMFQPRVATSLGDWRRAW